MTLRKPLSLLSLLTFTFSFSLGWPGSVVSLVGVTKNSILSSPRITNWGEWSEWEYCPNGTFVIGMRLKTEPVQGPLDDTSLNGVQFLCGKLGDKEGTNVMKIHGHVGHWGTWGTIFECDGYANGFQLRSEAPQDNADNTASNNMRLFCSKSKGFLEGGGLSWGDWTAAQKCPGSQVICALRTQVHSSQGPNFDDTSMNNIDAQCCDL